MLIVSFDAVGDSELDHLLKYQTVAAFTKEATLFREAETVFTSNTYPIHTSVATGVVPRVHGVIANTDPFPATTPHWHCAESTIKAKTLWQAAKERGIDTATAFWPVTAFSRTIRYNIPEVLARPGESQIMTNLKAGSKYLQLKYFLKYRPKINPKSLQPALDDFAAACMADIMRDKNPGLCMVHFTVYDSLRHKYGKNSGAINIAFETLDRNLALLLKAAGNRPVILFSDHSQLDLKKVLDPNKILVRAGLLKKKEKEKEYLAGESQCFIECCGGSAFFHRGTLTAEQVISLSKELERFEGFHRFLTAAEMEESGYDEDVIGFAPLPGYSYEAFAPNMAANHGYPRATPNYKVFYMIRGLGMSAGSVVRGGSLLDIAPLAAKHLGLTLDRAAKVL